MTVGQSIVLLKKRLLRKMGIKLMVISMAGEKCTLQLPWIQEWHLDIDHLRCMICRLAFSMLSLLILISKLPFSYIAVYHT